MKSLMVTSVDELVKVQCSQCKRVIRTTAPWGVVGEEGLRRIGWTVSETGKPVCDEHTEPLASWSLTATEARITQLLEQSAPSEHVAQVLAEAYDTETVNRYRHLILNLFMRTDMAPDLFNAAQTSAARVQELLEQRAKEGK